MLIASSTATTTTPDVGFFNKPSSPRMVASTSYAKPIITTRRAWKLQQQEDVQSPIFPEADSAATTPSSSDTVVVSVVRTRKEPHHPSGPSTKPSKKSRSPPPVHVPKPQPQLLRVKKREPSSLPPSRQTSRPRTLASSPEPEPEPIARSRSVSTFAPVDTPISRPCAIEEDGKPGPGFLSNEDVVWRLMENDRNYYKGCASSFVCIVGCNVNASFPSSSL